MERKYIKNTDFIDVSIKLQAVEHLSRNIYYYVLVNYVVICSKKKYGRKHSIAHV